MSLWVTCLHRHTTQAKGAERREFLKHSLFSLISNKRCAHVQYGQMSRLYLISKKYPTNPMTISSNEEKLIWYFNLLYTFVYTVQVFFCCFKGFLKQNNEPNIMTAILIIYIWTTCVHQHQGSKSWICTVSVVVLYCATTPYRNCVLKVNPNCPVTPYNNNVVWLSLMHSLSFSVSPCTFSEVKAAAFLL